MIQGPWILQFPHMLLSALLKWTQFGWMMSRSQEYSNEKYIFTMCAIDASPKHHNWPRVTNFTILVKNSLTCYSLAHIEVFFLGLELWPGLRHLKETCISLIWFEFEHDSSLMRGPVALNMAKGEIKWSESLLILNFLRNMLFLHSKMLKSRQYNRLTCNVMMIWISEKSDRYMKISV